MAEKYAPDEITTNETLKYNAEITTKHDGAANSKSRR